MEYNVNIVMQELQSLGNEQFKKIYMKHGAKEPLYGVRTGDLKPIARKIKKNYDLSINLYKTGNYDAMYLAGMIADSQKMTKEDFNDWIERAYCPGLSDYTVATTLAKSTMAQQIADEWISRQKELYQSAGWTCYCNLLKEQSNENFSIEKLKTYLCNIKFNIHKSANRVRYSMNNFVIAVGTFYHPLQEQALEVAKSIGEIYVDMGETNCKAPLATQYIKKNITKKWK